MEVGPVPLGVLGDLQVVGSRGRALGRTGLGLRKQGPVSSVAAAEGPVPVDRGLGACGPQSPTPESLLTPAATGLGMRGLPGNAQGRRAPGVNAPSSESFWNYPASALRSGLQTRGPLLGACRRMRPACC